MAVHWWTEMEMTKEERGWVGPKLLEYLRDAANHDKIGKYNGGQKVYFFTSKLGALGLLVSGIVMWYPTSFPAWVRQLAFLLHNVSFILFAVSLVFHIYLATVGRARHVQLDDARDGVEGVGAHPPPEVVPRAHGAREVVSPRRQEGFIRGGAPAPPLRFPTRPALRSGA